MQRYAVVGMFVVAVLLGSLSTGHAAVLTQTLGDADFTDGQNVATGTFTGANGGDPAPLNTFIGSDIGGPNFTATWTFNGYGGPIADTLGSGTLLLALYDGDSAAPGNQVQSFTLNTTVDLTNLFNTTLEAKPGQTGQENYYTIALPSAALTQVATGTATFSLALQGPGLGILGPTDFNGAGLDFSTLTLTTQTPTAVPEPTTLLLLGSGLAGLAVWKRKAIHRTVMR